MGSSILEIRLPRAHNCMKHRGVKYDIERNIGEHTDDLEEMYKKEQVCLFLINCVLRLFVFEFREK